MKYHCRSQECFLRTSLTSKRMWLSTMLLLLCVTCSEETDCIYGFSCGNGKCILPGLFCNDYDDCGDNTDEIPFEWNSTDTKGIACRRHWGICLLPEKQISKSHLICKKELDCNDGFMCGNGQCINPLRFCDNFVQCGDNTDEIEFDGTVAEGSGTACRNHFTICQLPKNQSSKSYLLCDRELNCNDGFLCGDGRCIRPDWFCDGYNDCNDNSDEIRVDENTTNLNGSACRQGFVCLLPKSQEEKSTLLCTKDRNCTNGFLCKNGKCINLDLFCNDEDDCGDNSDEIRVDGNATYTNGIACRTHSICLLENNQTYKSQLLCRQDLHCIGGFLCENGRCIISKDFCDGTDNCGDHSDEIRVEGNEMKLNGIACRQSYTCLLPENQVYKRRYICPFEIDCSDGFLCEDGACIYGNLFCDGGSDCFDHSDEIPVDRNATNTSGISCRSHWNICLLPESQVNKSQKICVKDLNCNDGFICTSGECIEPTKFCDGTPQCRDSDDELVLSDGQNLLCSSIDTDIMCSLPEYHVCDQTPHCYEGIDECLCSEGENKVFLDDKCFRCLSNVSIVIPLIHLCDGVIDCPDLTDECPCDGKQRPELCGYVRWSQHGEYSFSVTCSLNGSIGHTLEPVQICDSKKDCDNAVDEANCSRVPDAALQRPEVNAGKEVSPYYCQQLSKNVSACDGRPECRQSIRALYDEECSSCFEEVPEFCDTISLNLELGIGCANSPITFAHDLCDGISRCFDNLDEQGCSDWFYCKNGTADLFHVKWEKVCDTVEDCADGSDEGEYQNCSYFMCDDGGDVKYIKDRQVCDGTHDCAGGSDECQEKCIDSVFSDVKSMIKNRGVEFFVWLISFVSVIGNAAVIWFTVKDVYFTKQKETRVKRSRVVNKLLILNLSVSDFIVGIYTFAVVIQNSLHKGRYCQVDQDWRSSLTCSAIGSLLVIGSQQSVFTMVIITIFRAQGISSALQFEPKIWKFRIVIVAAWIFSVALAVVPLIPFLEDYFIDSVWYEGTKFFTTIEKERVSNLTDWLMLLLKGYNGTQHVRNDGSWATLEILISRLNAKLSVGRKFGFYSTHTVCLPTFFPNMKTDTAWWYSLLLISINFTSFVIVFIGSVIIYRSATVQTSATTEAMLKERSSAMQAKLSRIVITDFCCWMPVCIMGFLQLFGVDIPKEAYLPVALVVIPINSSLNPFLYSNVPDKIWEKVKEVYERFKSCRLWSSVAQENRAEDPLNRVMEMRPL